MGFAKRALRDHCQALFVYTGSEGRQPYTFYQRSGFYDLHYMREYRLADLPADLPPGVEVELLDRNTPDGTMLNDVFQAAYAPYAGFPVRHPGFWRRALDSEIFYELPQDFFLVSRREGSALAGYAILGLERQGSAAILELATRPEASGVAQQLLLGAAAAAASHSASAVSMITSSPEPAQSHLLHTGFRPSGRRHVLAGQVLDPAAIWRKLGGEGAGPALRVWTPEQEFDLPGHEPVVTMELKSTTLHRLLLCREDVGAALSDERITTPDTELPLLQLQSSFRPAPWVYHHLDWI